MSPQIDLNAFIEDQQDDGVFKGSGQFTIEHQKAARKMAKFALPRPTAWVCKFVQAAAGWPVSMLTVSQGRAYTVFHFEWTKLSELPTEDDLVRGILSSGISDDTPLGNLCMGLRALVEGEKLSFLVALNDGELKPKPVYAGAYFGEMSEEKRLSSEFRERKGLTVTIAHTPEYKAQDPEQTRRYVQARIIKELDGYCFLSPVPIMLDGRRVDDPIRAPRFQSYRDFRPLFTGGLPVCEGSLVMRTPKGFQERRMSLFTDPRRTLRQYQGELPEVSALILIGSDIGPKAQRSMAKSEICWVRSGVIVDTKSTWALTECLRCKVYLPADDLPTDLTGFKISQEAAKMTESLTLPQVGEFLRRLPLSEFALAEDRDQQSDEDDVLSEVDAQRGRIKKVLKGSGAGIGIVLFSPILGTLITLGSLANVYLVGEKNLQAEVEQERGKWADRLQTDMEALVDTFRSGSDD